MNVINSIFTVSDNTGVKKVLGITNLSRKTTKIFLGDIIVGIVKKVSSSSKLIYSTIVYGIVIRLKKNNSYLDDYNILFNDNSIVLIDKNSNTLGTRIFGSIPKYLKEKNYLKLNSLTVDFI